ncbi:hypothetical protein BGZ83_007013 [Gryganskiella cystojenkinii]|nr:hypothetical protein BGZ83_007013 [Gryganskiella cystojenkinii]
MSMSIDTAQWNQGPGSFPPETTIATTTSTHPGLDSASSSLSQRSSREGSDDPYGSNINFVYANEKRFGDYHSLFRSVPEKEKLIEDYGCALQKEILVQGRLYISEDHVCFNANIFGWVTNLVIAFSEITAIEKRMTAFVIPNAISIVTATNTKGHFFASFLSRDAAHDLLMAAWRKSFPCAANASAASVHYTNGHSRSNRSTLTVDDIDDDAQSFISGRDSRKNRHRRSFSGASMADYNPENWNDESKGGDDDGAESSSLRRRGSKRAAVRKLIKDVIAPIIPDDDHRNGSSLSPNNSGKKTGRARSVSELPPRPVSFDGGPRDNHRESVGSTSRNSLDQDSLSPSFRPRSGTESSPSRHPDLYSAAAAFSKQSAPVLSIPAHGSKPSAPAAGTVVAGIAMAGPGRATTCKCSKDGRHYANTFMTETYPGSVEAMWKLLFDSNFAKEFLTSEAMKGADVQEDSWQKTSNGTSTKTTRYTKWLGMPIGPKTTKAILTDVCEIKNFEDYTTTVTTTSTPDVPSGGSFTTKVRTCITWAGPGQVQMVVTGAVEFTKSSWIKGQIEKGAAEGLTTHYKELNKTLRKYIAAHPKEFPAPGAAPVAAVAAPAVVSIQAAQPPPATAQSVQFESRPQSVAFEDEKHQQSQPRGSVSPFKSSPSKQVGLLDGIGSILSKALDSFKRVSSPSSTSARNRDSVEGPNLAVISVLVLLLAGNFYIWFQMSSVTAQVEQIQAHLMADGHPRPEKPPTPPPAPKQPAGQANTGGFKGSASRARQAWIDLNDDLLEREYEEDVMWAWLTERQARHQQYRRSSGFYYPTETIVRMEKEEQAEKEKERLSETETKLQARIQQLQDQVAELERHTSALKVGTRAAVLEQEEDIPVE